MSIPTVNVVGLYNFPTLTGQIVASRGGTADDSRILRGTASPVLDGSLTTFTLNFIDGTNTLPFTPTAVKLVRAGAGTAAVAVYPVFASSITATSCTVNLSAAGSNAQTCPIAVEIWK